MTVSQDHPAPDARQEQSSKAPAAADPSTAAGPTVKPVKPVKPLKPAKPLKDDGLRRLLTWTFVALAVTLILAALGVSLAVYWFDPG